MTLNYVPCSRALQKSSQMPLAAIVQPFALLAAGEEPLQVTAYTLYPLPYSILQVAASTRVLFDGADLYPG